MALNPDNNTDAFNDRPESRSFPSLKAHLLYWPIAVIGIALDLWSKHAVFNWLYTKPDREFSVIDGFFNLVIRLNDGAAFSIAAGQRTILVTISFVAMVAVLGIFLFGTIRRKITLIALSMFTAGVIGNLYDRMFNDGLVRDFLDFYYGNWHWPAFNVADSMLCIGVGLLFIANFTSASCQKSAHQQK